MFWISSCQMTPFSRWLKNLVKHRDFLCDDITILYFFMIVPKLFLQNYEKHFFGTIRKMRATINYQVSGA